MPAVRWQSPAHIPRKEPPGHVRPAVLPSPPRPILNRLRHVPGLDGLDPVQVGDGASQLEDTVEGSGGDVELGHGGFEEALGHAVHLAVLADLGGGHLGVANQAVPSKRRHWMARADSTRARTADDGSPGRSPVSFS